MRIGFFYLLIFDYYSHFSATSWTFCSLEYNARAEIEKTDYNLNGNFLSSFGFCMPSGFGVLYSISDNNPPMNPFRNINKDPCYGVSY